ncbi:MULTISPECIES: pyridoxamine 5'-phosphate oxidase family protein [Streptomyces]|uniref:TIGR03618 family F420-dependent PPOX class oxidoreductase n=1 Tax=Streptomyces edwardsiae TaxID=3075527 RepID=A0ABU2QMQ1_9ACTN|nr:MULTISPECIES: TIGR03618 family F420-dependent PPOX class oxidoreductase [unclassified Streptomyces]MDT0405741.1 TIGR03618 family F420-dependent PPOX class oxidoreductase [Streptomyces sp. DSM 41635]
MASYSVDPGDPDASYLSFWREKHLCTLTTLRLDGTPHVVPVAVTYDPGARLARVVASSTSAKVRHVLASEGAAVAVCQVDGRRWATLEGRAVVRGEPERVAEAERRYAERYGRTPRPNPSRVVIEIALTRAMGRG